MPAQYDIDLVFQILKSCAVLDITKKIISKKGFEMYLKTLPEYVQEYYKVYRKAKMEAKVDYHYSNKIAIRPNIAPPEKNSGK